jgi:hypothetical protein
LDYQRRSWFEEFRGQKEILIVLEQPRTIVTNFSVASEKIASDPRFPKETECHKRRNYANVYTLGNVLNHGKGKSEEGKKIDLNGFLQYPLNWVQTAVSCYLSRS